MNIEQWINPAVANMQAYAVQAVPDDALRLSDMECPQDIAPELRDAWLQRLSNVAMNRYPRPGHDAIETRLRSLFNIPRAMPMIFGNGSDELIQIILTAVASPHHCILAPSPTFVMYKMVTQMLGMRYLDVALNSDDFSLDMAAMLHAIETHQPATIFLADPNNPTGNVHSQADIERIIQAAPGLVVLDEAYGAYAPEHNNDLVQRYDNVIVIRTLSKVGYAGLRFGYAFGSAEWMEALVKVKPPYNINVLTRASVDFALQHDDFITEQTKLICAERERMLAAYQHLPNAHVWPSAANFLLMRLPNAEHIHQQLVKQHIWVKNLHGTHPALTDCLRVTISNRDDNQRCFSAIQTIIENSHAAS